MTKSSRFVSAVLLVLAALAATVPGHAQAQARAWLDRDRIAMGETATLNIETGAAGAPAPDYSPLEADFVVSGHSSRRQFQVGGGGSGASTLYAVALQPRRQGVLRIPALRVGGATTAPLALTVAPATPTRAGGVVFIETEADHAAPYVQQAVGFVVRLYYATQLISGQLDQPTPDGAALQRVGSDLQYSRDIGGRRYTVVERRYLLVPERSGPLTLPPARFEGRGVGGFFDDIFGDGQRALSALGPRRVLDVRPVPPGAAQPWLPLHGLDMRHVDPPTRGRAGDAVDVVVEATADGANATQLPDLQLQVGDGAQVFAEPAQVDETFDAGRPRVRVTRRFSIVPAREGVLRVGGPRVDWWDVGAARARTATLEDLRITVAAAATVPDGAPVAAFPSAARPAAEDDAWVRVPGVQGEVRPWALATVVFALLWLVTLMWALNRTAAGPAAPAPADAARSGGTGMRALRHALDGGDLGDVFAALCAMAAPPAADADALLARLDDAAQRDAVVLLQRARWGDGAPASARTAVRAAFAKGPSWRAEGVAAPALLPPLYPERGDGG